MSFLQQLISPKKESKDLWEGRRIGLTGASGSLGMALTKALRSKGSYVIGLTHKSISRRHDSEEEPNRWVQWSCGEEKKLISILKTLDVLFLNHGINPGGNLKVDGLNKALEVNALSNWRLIELFEKIVFSEQDNTTAKEIWINTSEAEIQPAFSPSYEISKRLIGQLVSFKYNSLSKKEKSKLKLKKIILGPFKSQLNPIGIMNVNLVADRIVNQSNLCSNLIIVTPNPITYLLMPLTEISRSLYFQLFKNRK